MQKIRLLLSTSLLVAIAAFAVASSSAQQSASTDKREVKAESPVGPGSEIRQLCNEARGDFGLTLSLDRSDRRYAKDESIKINATCARDAYLYLFYEDVSGDLVPLFPLHNENNFIKGQTTLNLPTPSQSFTINVNEPFGTEYIFAVATSEPISGFALGAANTKLKSVDSEILEKAKPVFQKAINHEIKVSSNDSTKAVRSESSTKEYVEFGTQTVQLDTFATAKKRDAVPPKCIFVGVGIDQYDSKRLNTLRACVNDVNDLKNLLIEQGIVKKENCLVLLGEDTTKENIRQLFTNDLPTIARGGDKIIVCWSGHGLRAAANEVVRMYLATKDCDTEDAKSMISDDEFGRWLLKVQNCQVFCLLDTCYSGRAIDLLYYWKTFVSEPPTSTKGIGQSDIGVITSADADEKAGFNEENSFMIGAVLKSLREKRNLDSYKLYETIYDEVKQEGQKAIYADAFTAPFIVNPSPQSDSTPKDGIGGK